MVIVPYPFVFDEETRKKIEELAAICIREGKNDRLDTLIYARDLASELIKTVNLQMGETV